MSSRPLRHLKVLDLGTFIAAPFSATILAEFGAEVIKIEVPRQGDSLRTLGAEHNGVPLFWLQESRNKHTLTCNLRESAGQEILRDLVRNGYNVVLENFRPGTLEGWGLGYEELSAIDPRCHHGPDFRLRSGRPEQRSPGFGRIAQAFGGLTYLCGFPDRPPANPGSATIADYISGLFVAFGVLVADRERAATEADRSSTSRSTKAYSASSTASRSPTRSPARFGRDGDCDRARRPSQPLPSRDGRWIAIACTNDRIFGRLANLMGQRELTSDPRFCQRAFARRNRDRPSTRSGADGRGRCDMSLAERGAATGRNTEQPDLQHRGHFRRPSVRLARKLSRSSHIHSSARSRCRPSFLGFPRRPAGSSGSAGTSARTRRPGFSRGARL